MVNWRNADILTAHILASYAEQYGFDRPTIVQQYSQSRDPAMAKIKLPDKTEIDAATAICEGCGKPMDEHTCEATAPVRTTKPRAKPEEKPPCPHCGGAFHFSMPGGLQNTECIMRQFYVDQGVIENPYQRLPVFTLEDIAAAVEWANDLKKPITYGRMESAAGGSGTWSSIKKAADAANGTATPKREKKAKPAAKGERIEDMAAAVAPTPTKNGKGKRAKATAGEDVAAQPLTTSRKDRLKKQPVAETAPVSRKDRLKGGKAEVVATTAQPVATAAPVAITPAATRAKRTAPKKSPVVEVPPAQVVEDAEAAARRARRQQLLGRRS